MRYESESCGSLERDFLYFALSGMAFFMVLDEGIHCLGRDKDGVFLLVGWGFPGVYVEKTPISGSDVYLLLERGGHSLFFILLVWLAGIVISHFQFVLRGTNGDVG